MNAQLQLRVQRYGWDKAAPYYENGWKNFLQPAQDLLIQMAQLVEGEEVLDISAGTGIVSLKAAKIVAPKGSVLGVDISQKMVESARCKAQKANQTNVFYDRMEAEELTMPNQCFDVALNAFGLMYSPNPSMAIKEMHRILRPGGKVVSAVWGARAKCGWSAIFPIVDARVKTDVCPLFFQLGTGNALAQLYKTCGFDNIKCMRIQTLMHYTSAQQAILAVFAGGPVAMAYARFNESTKAAAHQEYLASIEPYRIKEEYFIPGEFVIVAGRKTT